VNNAGLFRSYPLTATETNSRRKENMMGTESRPNSDYTRTWSPSGEIGYATLADGTRLRYLKAGSGPALILLHTVRTQLDHFQLVIPKLVHAFTVFAIDMPGMGWSDIRPGASYAEPALRRATVEFVKTLDHEDVTLAGESMGATVSLTASTELEDRVLRILAFNTYDYPEGLSRANRVASICVGGARLSAVGQVVTRMENKPALGIVLRGGLVTGASCQSLLGRAASGRPPSRLPARGARGLPQCGQHDRRPSTLWSRHRPVTLIYGDHDWSRIPEREANLSLLRGARSISLPSDRLRRTRSARLHHRVRRIAQPGRFCHPVANTDNKRWSLCGNEGSTVQVRQRALQKPRKPAFSFSPDGGGGSGGGRPDTLQKAGSGVAGGSAAQPVQPATEPGGAQLFGVFPVMLLLSFSVTGPAKASL
jgi:pimeloyl-ACP methyl ester carboxylesterase